MLTRKEVAEELKAMLPHLEGVSIVGRTAYEMAIDALYAHVDKGDYISREAAIEKITALINKSGKYTAYESGADDACFILEHEIPAADVRPVVRGEWCPAKDGYYGHVMCSACHKIESHKTNFCPNCGADMREVGEDG